jgi:hypothetical protein
MLSAQRRLLSRVLCAGWWIVGSRPPKDDGSHRDSQASNFSGAKIEG